MLRRSFALLTLLAVAGCVPERVAVGPNGEIATHDAVYRPAEDGTLEIDTRVMEKVAELHPAWIDPKTAGERTARFLWSPAGTRLAVFVTSKEDAPAPGWLHVLSYPGLETMAAWELPHGQPHLPAFGPDGRFLGFSFEEPGHRTTLRVVDLSDPASPPRTLAEHNSAGHAWSPDGRRIAALVGSGSGLDQYSLGTLVVVRVDSGETRAITGVLFHPTSTVEWSAATGRIYFLSPSIALPVPPQSVAEARWAVYAVEPDAPRPVPAAAVPADLAGLEGHLASFARAPSTVDRFVLVTRDGDVGRAWLYQPGAAPELAPLHGDDEAERPSVFSVPSWTDESTWVYKAKDGVRRGRVGDPPRNLVPTPMSAIYRLLRTGFLQLGSAVETLGKVFEFVRAAREKPEEMEYFVVALEQFVASGAGGPTERAWAVLVLGLVPDRPSAREALAARLGDEALVDGISVRSYAGLALDRMVESEPYPEGLSPLVDILRLEDVAAASDAAREAELSRRAGEWAERLRGK